MTTRKLWEIEELLSKNGGPLPLSRAGVYTAVRNGHLPSVRVGKRVFVPDWAVQKLISEPDKSFA